MTGQDDKLIVRAYRPGDEEDVRRICCETALYGGPISGLIEDCRLVTEALIGYHLRIEPESLLVAVVQDEVIGYIAGCMDTGRFRGLYLRYIAPRILARILVKGHWADHKARRVILRGAQQTRQWSIIRRPILRDYPAHLHINISAGHRGYGIGSCLLAHFFGLLRARKVGGVHATTASEEGRRFFEKAGWSINGSVRARSVKDDAEVSIWLMTSRSMVSEHCLGRP